MQKNIYKKQKSLDGINVTKKQYVAELIENDLEQKLQQIMKQTSELEVKSNDTQKGWDRGEVIEALGEFIYPIAGYADKYV